jgi:hypothetical protein
VTRLLFSLCCGGDHASPFNYLTHHPSQALEHGVGGGRGDHRCEAVASRFDVASGDAEVSTPLPLLGGFASQGGRTHPACRLLFMPRSEPCNLAFFPLLRKSYFESFISGVGVGTAAPAAKIRNLFRIRIAAPERWIVFAAQSIMRDKIL